MAAHHSAQGLASLGRHGDTMLVHMSPHEVAGLNFLAKKQGTKLTINPDTGLPEAFNLGGLFSAVLPMFAGSFFPGAGFSMAPLLAGAATGAGLAAVKGENPLMGGLMGGLGGVSGSNLAQGLAGAASGAASAGTPYSMAGGWVDPSTIGAMAGPQLPGAALANTGLNVPGASMMTNPAIVNAANTVKGAGFMNSAMSGAGNLIDKGFDKLSTMGTGAKNLITGQPGAVEGFKNAFIDPTTGTGALTSGEMAMKIGMPIGGAVLGGLEPSDLYGDMNLDDAKKKQAYDPYAKLNLDYDTGLRLYAGGGSVNTGGLSGQQNVYGTMDGTKVQNLPAENYGLGRLNNLASMQAMQQAETYGYANGGMVSFADGGGINPITGENAPAEDLMGIAALAPTQSMPSQSGQDAMASLLGVADASTSGGGIIEQVNTKLQQNPNYQPQNPIEAAIVKQLKGTDPMQDGQQGLGSLGPAQPMAPTYNASQPIGPTYFAGMNAPGAQMAKGGYLDGQGDGMSDSIPATIEGKQPARLADGEFVVPADVVSHIGNGSSKAGSKRLYSMLERVRKARTGHTKQGKQIKPEKYMPA